MVTVRELRKVDDAAVRQALLAGAAVRRFAAEQGNTKWVVYSSSADDGVPVAVVESDRLAQFLAETHGAASFLPGSAARSNREVGSTVAATVDRRRERLELQLARIQEREQRVQAQLAQHVGPSPDRPTKI